MPLGCMNAGDKVSSNVLSQSIMGVYPCTERLITDSSLYGLAPWHTCSGFLLLTG